MSRKILKQNATAKDFNDPNDNYIGYHDFALRGMVEAVFKIVSLDIDEIPIPMSSKTQTKMVANLEGQKKALILSKRKMKILTRMFGAVENWPGKTIKIVADPNIRFKGETVGGLVITNP
jgi:hypothetical protein